MRRRPPSRSRPARTSLVAFGVEQVTDAAVTRNTSGAGHSFTLTQTRLWTMSATLRFAQNATGGRTFELRAGGSTVLAKASGPKDTDAPFTANLSVTRRLPAGTVITAVARHDSSSPVSRWNRTRGSTCTSTWRGSDMAFTYVTITHVYETAADVPAAGFIDFTPVKPMHNGLTVVQKTISAPLSGSGALSQLLAANTDPDTTPTGTTYEVTERITGQPKISYFIQVPHDQGPSLDIRSLAGWVGATGGGGGGGGVLSVNSELPDGSGNIVVSAADLGAQTADADLTGLAALADGYPRRASGVWAVRTAAQLGVDLATAPTRITLTASAGSSPPTRRSGAGPHKHTATADVTLASPTGGVNGQRITVVVVASGAMRLVSFPGGTDPVGVGPQRVGVRRRPAV
jgi:hypothetical protein